MNGNDDTPRHFEPIPAEVGRTASTAVDAVVAVHRALGPGLRLGLLVSFNVAKIRHGIRRMVL